MWPHVRSHIKTHVARCGNVPGGGRGRVPQVKLHVQLPAVLAQRIEDRIQRDGSATSVADFLRQAAVKELDRQESVGSGLVDAAPPTRKKDRG
jgi:hypothetical protein